MAGVPQPATKSGWLGETLKAIRNPMIFNAFSIAAMSLLVYGCVHLDLNSIRGAFLGVNVLFIIAVTGWLNFFAWKNPRFLAYGPDEYLRESELEHERGMAGASGSSSPV
jgi:hypothetical protein